MKTSQLYYSAKIKNAWSEPASCARSASIVLRTYSISLRRKRRRWEREKDRERILSELTIKSMSTRLCKFEQKMMKDGALIVVKEDERMANVHILLVSEKHYFVISEVSFSLLMTTCQRGNYYKYFNGTLIFLLLIFQHFWFNFSKYWKNFW